MLVSSNELTVLERAEHLARRKAIYEAQYPETKRGGDRGNQHTGGKERQTEIISFSQDAAAKTGVTDRTIRQEVAIAERLDDDVREAVRDTPLAVLSKPDIQTKPPRRAPRRRAAPRHAEE